MTYQKHPHQEEETEKETKRAVREMEGSDAIKAKEGESFIKIMVQGIQCCREGCCIQWAPFSQTEVTGGLADSWFRDFMR